MDYKLTLLQSTALPTELSKVWRPWVTFHFSCELLVHNAFVKKKRWYFTPSSRIWTSDLWITNLLYYSPPLYQLSYRRFDDREWHFISCELLVHNAIVKKPEKMGYKFAFLQSTALSLLDDREWLFISWIWTSEKKLHFLLGLQPMDLLYYSPPLYQLSYRRFDDREWHFISCELLVHNAFVKKKK